MRQTVGKLNRAWLAVIGTILLLGGLVATAIAVGVSTRLLTAAGTGVSGPRTTSKIIGSSVGSVFGQTWVIVLVGVVGLILGILGLAWLLAQIPKVNAAKAFRLHDDADRGQTVVQPSVLTSAVEQETEALSGVSAASAVLRGTANEPELTLKVTANDRTDLPQLLTQIQTDVAGHLSTAMETPLRRLAVQLDITAAKRTNDTVTL